MKQLCKGRIVAITGAGRGLGRAYALEYARQGACVVVNDLGTSSGGEGASVGPASDVVREIQAMGGQAIANTDDISEWNGAERFIRSAIQSFGGLDVLVNNAGVLRDKMFVNMTEDEWDVVIKVHLKGTFCPMRHAAAYWREESKAGRQRVACVINTSSGSGLFANPGQANYGAAKSGIATLSLIAAKELARYGVSVNAIYPTAHSRLTEDVFKVRPPRDSPGGLDPEAVAPAVVWLGSADAAAVTGRVFGVRGNSISLAEEWKRGTPIQRADVLNVQQAGEAISSLLASESERASHATE